MEARKLRLGFLLAAGALALAFVLSLAPDAQPLAARQITPEIAATAGVLFLLAAWFADGRATVAGLIGAALAATASLMLLHDDAIAGSAQIGFWMLAIAAWLAVAFALVNLANLRSCAVRNNAP